MRSAHRGCRPLGCQLSAVSPTGTVWGSAVTVLCSAVQYSSEYSTVQRVMRRARQLRCADIATTKVSQANVPVDLEKPQSLERRSNKRKELGVVSSSCFPLRAAKQLVAPTAHLLLFFLFFFLGFLWGASLNHCGTARVDNVEPVGRTPQTDETTRLSSLACSSCCCSSLLESISSFRAETYNKFCNHHP